MPESANPGCGVKHYVYGENHACECRYPYCTGFDHVCLCGSGWHSSVRTCFISFDPRGYAAGDPCRTRMKIMWDRSRKMWRVFELAQVGQTISRHGDIWVGHWNTARNTALGWIESDRKRMSDYLDERYRRMLADDYDETTRRLL